MSKLPRESRPWRLMPEIQRVDEEKLQPLTGKTLEKAQGAVLKVYQSGQQMASEQWVAAYGNAIDSAIEK
jgi:cell division FtsZ-interacting protein ZapD